MKLKNFKTDIIESIGDMDSIVSMDSEVRASYTVDKYAF